MFKTIMIPVDLAHTDALSRALACGAALAKQTDAALVLAGVTGQAPGPLGHNPAEYATKLEAFAASFAGQHGVAVRSHVVESHDPAAEINTALMRAVKETGADLVVMQSHAPGLSDYIFEGHGPYLAQHAPASVMLVRD